MSTVAEVQRLDEAPPSQETRPADMGSDLPLTIIERRPDWRVIDLGEIWRYRELLFQLIRRDIMVRYKQTVLGAAWAVLVPFAMMVAFSLFVGRVAESPAGALPYPLFVFAGLLPWTFFANAINSAGQSVVGNQGLVTKVYFPRLIIPFSAVAAGLVDFAIASGMLMLLMLYYGLLPGWQLLVAPLIMFGLVITALGVGTLLSALTVSYRDFRHAVPFLVQIWMFSTPSIYLQAESVVGPRGQALLLLNPVHGLIANFRSAMLDGALDLGALSASTAVGLILFVIGCVYFRRVERGFADII